MPKAPEKIKILFTDKVFVSLLLFTLFTACITFTGLFLQSKGLIRQKPVFSGFYRNNAVFRMVVPAGTRMATSNVIDTTDNITEKFIFKNISGKNGFDALLNIPVYPYPVLSKSNSERENPLDPFYRALTENLKATNKRSIKTALFGDSVIAGDIFPYYFRRENQAVFGYGGPGFVCMARPYRYYFNNDIKWEQEGSWRVSGVMDWIPRNDGIKGFVFTGSNGAAVVFNSPPNRRREFNRANLYYMESPAGKYIQVSVDSNRTFIDSSSRSNRCAVKKIILSQNNSLKISCGKKQKAFFYGVEFVRTNAGFVLDTFPVQGANSGHMLKISQQVWKSQMGSLRPDLVIVMYDINLFGYADFPEQAYRNQFRLFIDRLRSAYTNQPILVISPMGKAEKKGVPWSIMPAVREIIKAQKEVALEKNCAFLDLYGALGGQKALAMWYGSVQGEDLLNTDKVHLSYKGAERLSGIVFSILMTDYRKYLVRHRILKAEPVATPSPTAIKQKGKNAF
jgi:lysophospholipase L1-like esterase